MSKIQLKIMCALALLVMVVVGASGFLAETGLRERTTANLVENLEQKARLVGQVVADVPFERASSRQLQQVARSG